MVTLKFAALAADPVEMERRLIYLLAGIGLVVVFVVLGMLARTLLF
jgi:hypothetical protein